MELQIEEIIPQEKGRARIGFDNGTSIVLYKGEMKRLALSEGSTVSAEMYQTILTDILGKRAIKRAMHLLERRDLTQKQLFDKLKQNEYPESCIEAAIEYVKSYHYIDYLRFARMYIRYHQEGKSRQRLKMDLLAKGVDFNDVVQALEEEYCSDDIRKIKKLLEKRHFVPETADRGEIRRNYQFLMRKGYGSSDIIRAMR